MRPVIAAILVAILALGIPVADAREASLPNGQIITLAEGKRGPTHFEISGHGTLVIEPDGSVSAVDLDIKPAIRENYLRAIMDWTFKPVEIDGQAVRAKAHFQLEAFGKPIPGTDRVSLGIEHVHFTDPPAEGGNDTPRRNPLSPPDYPLLAAQDGFGASVTLLLRLDEELRVVDAGVVNLTLDAWEIQNSRSAAGFARSFAIRAMNAARDWSLAGFPEVEPGCTVLVPVVFLPPHRSQEGWRPQIPVEVTPLPWMETAQQEAIAMTMAGNAASSRFQMRNEVAGTTVD